MALQILQYFYIFGDLYDTVYSLCHHIMIYNVSTASSRCFHVFIYMFGRKQFNSLMWQVKVTLNLQFPLQIFCIIIDEFASFTHLCIKILWLRAKQNVENQGCHFKLETSWWDGVFFKL